MASSHACLQTVLEDIDEASGLMARYMSKYRFRFTHSHLDKLTNIDRTYLEEIINGSR